MFKRIPSANWSSAAHTGLSTSRCSHLRFIRFAPSKTSTRPTSIRWYAAIFTGLHATILFRYESELRTFQGFRRNGYSRTSRVNFWFLFVEFDGRFYWDGISISLHFQIQHKLGTNCVAKEIIRLFGNEETMREYCVKKSTVDSFGLWINLKKIKILEISTSPCQEIVFFFLKSF